MLASIKAGDFFNTLEESSMFMTNGAMRRFLMFQKSKFPNISESMWDRYRIYVECVGFTEHPKTLSEWIGE